jgi:predicted DsbA family dithiol-disulfide isomerase
VPTIEVFADVACPFTHVGLRRFVQRRHELGRDDVRLHVRSWPLEIVNGRPLDATFIAEEVDEIRPQVGGSLFVGFRQDAFPASSLAAMSLAAAAYAVDDATGELVSLALRDLLFEQGIDIADPGVLAGVAAEHGITADLTDHTAVLAEHLSGVERGVIGSPHFFTAGGSFFCPSLDISRDAQSHLRITADAGFDAFVDACLAS